MRKRTAIYARVSTEEQRDRGESIDDQIAGLRRWAKEHDCYLIDRPFVDAGYSGHRAYKTRPALCELIRLIERDEVDLVLFTKLDRWTRKASNYYALQDILEAHGVSWRAILEDYDTETTDGRLKVSIMLGVNQHEAERTGDRIRYTFRQKRERGELVSGNLPRGYKIVNKKPVIDEAAAAPVRAFWRSYLDTGSLKAARAAAAAYGLHLGMSSCSYMLRHADVYAGRIQGIECEGYVTEEEADRILRSRNAAARDTGEVYLFSGICYCAECGGRLGSHRRKLVHGMQRWYNCTRHYAERGCSNAVNMAEGDIESYVLDSLDKVIAEQATAASIAANDTERINRHAEAESAIKRLEARRERLIDLYMDGELDKEAFIRRRDQIDEELEAENKKEAASRPEVVTTQIVTLPADWRSTYSLLSRKAQAELWRSYISRIEVGSDRSIRISL